MIVSSLLSALHQLIEIRDVRTDSENTRVCEHHGAFNDGLVVLLGAARLHTTSSTRAPDETDLDVVGRRMGTHTKVLFNSILKTVITPSLARLTFPFLASKYLESCHDSIKPVKRKWTREQDRTLYECMVGGFGLQKAWMEFFGSGFTTMQLKFRSAYLAERLCIQSRTHADAFSSIASASGRRLESERRVQSKYRAIESATLQVASSSESVVFSSEPILSRNMPIDSSSGDDAMLKSSCFFEDDDIPSDWSVDETLLRRAA